MNAKGHIKSTEMSIVNEATSSWRVHGSTFAQLLSGIFLIVMGLCQTGCNDTEPSTQDSTKKKPADQLYIEVSAAGNSDYWYDHKVGLKMAGQLLGVKTEYVGPTTYNMGEMVTAIEQAIAKKPQGLLIVGFEPVLNSIIDKAVGQGIPVVTVDSDCPDSKRLAFVGTGNYQAGYEVGKILAERIGGRGKIAVTTIPSASNLQERVRGFKDAISKYPEIELVYVADTQGDTIITTQACVTVIQKFPDLAGIGSVEAIGGVGAATAVREAGKIGKIKIVAMDRSNDVLENIKDGVISATVVQQTALMPFYGVEILYNIYNSSVSISSEDTKAGVPGCPSFVDTGIVVVDKSNCEYFMR